MCIVVWCIYLNAGWTEFNFNTCQTDQMSKLWQAQSFSHLCFISLFTPPSPSYPLLRLPLPGTGPVEFTTGVRDYSVPSHEPQGDLGERPDWVGEEKAHYIQIYCICIPVFLNHHFCPYSFNCTYSLILNPHPKTNSNLKLESEP